MRRGRCGSSQEGRRAVQRARGRVGDGESARAASGDRGGRRRSSRRCRPSQRSGPGWGGASDDGGDRGQRGQARGARWPWQMVSATTSSARVCSGEEAEKREGVGREQRATGEAEGPRGMSRRIGGASMASRRWQGWRRRSPPSCFGARGRNTTERSAGLASSDGPHRAGPLGCR